MKCTGKFIPVITGYVSYYTDVVVINCVVTVYYTDAVVNHYVAAVTKQMGE